MGIGDIIMNAIQRLDLVGRDLVDFIMKILSEM